MNLIKCQVKYINYQFKDIYVIQNRELNDLLDSFRNYDQIKTKMRI